MLTIKNRGAFGWAVFVALLAMLAGCAPPGPRALLAGKKLIEQGRYAEAIEKLSRATSLLKTNAQAFNYLGMAYHYADRPEEATRAYKHALVLNHDLVEAHFNLGCLYLGQNTPEKLEAAKAEFTAFTLRKSNAPEGFVKLGTVQLRTREPQSAERSFSDALRLAPNDPEALTGCGLARLQRGRATDAAQFFRTALARHPGYGPALLNLAIVEHEYLRDRAHALEHYQQYLALKPPPPDVQAVQSVVNRIEAEQAPQSHPPATSTIKASAPSPKPAPSSPQTSAPKLTTSEPQTMLAKSAPVSKPEPPKTAAVAKFEPPAPQPPSQTKPYAAPQTFAPSETVHLPAEPVIKPARDLALKSPPPPAQPPSATTAVQAVPAPSKAPKKGFFQKVNPINLFSSENTPRPSTPLSPKPVSQPGETKAEAAKVAPQTSSSDASSPRYTYKPRPKPSPGNHTEAERAFAQALQAHQAHHIPEAIQAYRRAVHLDPAFFDPYYNLGLAAAEMGNLQLSLWAYEGALAVTPNSLDARYNFALALKQGNYLLDAAAELEKLLRLYPNESRAHLVLGNIYAQQLHDSAKARHHYLKVLENDPRNPQAANIRYWLAENPR